MKRDSTIYNFEDHVNLGKGALVLAVIERYAKDNQVKTIQELSQKFPESLKTGSNSLPLLTSQIATEKLKRRYHKDPIKLEGGGDVFVCNQWGIGNIKPFIEHCRKVHGYKIEERLK